jgi:hypothetical protein
LPQLSTVPGPHIPSWQPVDTQDPPSPLHGGQLMGLPQLSTVSPHCVQPEDTHPPPLLEEPLPLPPLNPPSPAGNPASAPCGRLHCSMQAPPMHASPIAHFVPHAPQFWPSLDRSVQADVAFDPAATQMVWPEGQALAHVPPAVHTSPDVGQSGLHEPDEHIWPSVHVTPQPPQLFGSLSESVHSLPH